MYNSLDPYTVKNAEVSEPKRNSLFIYQMWKSDLHSLKRTESNEIKNNN